MNSPFFILSFQRSGTHLLASLLDSHPQINMFDEYFARKKIKNSSTPQIFPFKPPHELWPGEGMIIMYKQYAQKIKDRDVVRKRPVIHLYRKDIEEHARSVHFMNSVPTHTTQQLDTGVKGSVDERTIKRISNKIKRKRRMVDIHNFDSVLDIAYEDITGGEQIKSAHLPQVCEFLGVEDRELTTSLNKVL